MSIFNEADLSLQSEKDFSISFRTLKKAKRMTLRIRHNDGKICVTAPTWVSIKQAEKFVEKHTAWIESELSKLPKTALETGTVLLEGVETQIHRKPISDRPKIRGIPTALLTEEGIHVWGDDIEAGLSLKKLIKSLAEEKLSKRLQLAEETVGFKTNGLRIRDASSRWGSCSKDKRVMLNWRLICAPAEVQDYVILHELSHLKHFDHSQSFWNLVDSLCPNGKKGRISCEKWLSLHTKRLQRSF